VEVATQLVSSSVFAHQPNAVLAVLMHTSPCAPSAAVYLLSRSQVYRSCCVHRTEMYATSGQQLQLLPWPFISALLRQLAHLLTPS
jgi:hypothetical protein